MVIDFPCKICISNLINIIVCLLLGVLPGPPTFLKAPLISGHFAILEWKPPKILSDTVKNYHLNIRKLGSGDEYTVVEKVI